jgi:hypothetical protein
MMMAAPKRFETSHEERNPQVRLLVVESRSAAGRLLAVVDILAGEVRAGMWLVASETGERWEVRGTAFVPVETVEQGRQGILLTPIGHQGGLTPGTRLEQMQAAVVGATD